MERELQERLYAMERKLEEIEAKLVRLALVGLVVLVQALRYLVG